MNAEITKSEVLENAIGKYNNATGAAKSLRIESDSNAGELENSRLGKDTKNDSISAGKGSGKEESTSDGNTGEVGNKETEIIQHITDKDVKENENESEILGTEGKGLHGRKLSEDTETLESGKQTGRNDTTDSNEPISGIQHDNGEIDRKQSSGNSIQNEESNSERIISNESEQRNVSEGTDGAINVSENQNNRVKKNKNNYSIDFDIDSKKPNLNDNIEA